MNKILILLFLMLSLFSKGQKINGKVYGNDKEGKQLLPGVNIYWENTKTGVASKNDGSFEIKKGINQHMLVFSYVGYLSKTIHIDENETIEVILEPNLEIGEVTVVEKDRGSYISTINPIYTTNIGAAELCKAACCNLAESFETNPSVDVSYSDAVTGAKQIRLLGLDGIYSLLQIENMPDLRGLATNFGLMYVPGPWMESIQVSKGTSSVINGYESISGQINAEFKKPDSMEKLFLNTFGSLDGRYEFNGNTNLKVYKDKITTGIFVHASGLSKRNDHNHDGFLDDPLSKQFQFSNRWRYNDHKGMMIQSGLNLLYEDRTGGQVNFDKEMKRTTINPYGINIETNRTSGYLKIGKSFADGHTAIALLSNFAIHHTNSFYGLTDFDAKEKRFYSNLVFTRDLNQSGTHVLNSGVSFVYDVFDEGLYGRDLSRTEKVPGLFSEYTYMPNKRLTLLAGIRTDFHNIFGTFVTPRIHLKYQIGEHLTFRSNAGKGFRTANVVSENLFLLAGSRPIQWSKDVFQEEAWNFGLSLVQKYSLFDRDLTISSEFFRTDFNSQLIVDRETSMKNVILTELDGKSYANSLQVDVSWQPVKRLDVLVAYRINDVKQTIGGQLLEKPLTSRYKGLITMNYATKMKKWVFDYTTQFNGGGRMPDIPFEDKELMHYSVEDFRPFTIINAQVTKYFRYWNLYVGAENLTNFKQKHPVLNYENPFGPGFDATTIWGPVMGRRIYAGLRFTLNYN